MNDQPQTDTTTAEDTVVHEASAPETQGKDLQAPSEQNQALATAGPDQGGDNLLAQLMAASKDPNIDLDRVDRMLSIYNQEMDRHKEQAFSESLAAAQAEIGNVVASTTNNQTKSKYAKLADVHAAAKPIWTRHGFAVSSYTQRGTVDGTIKVVMDIRHKGGHKVTLEDDWPIDLGGIRGNENKTAIQAKGSTSSYARRYSECMFFDIAIEEDDNDGNAVGGDQELSQAASDWVAKIQEATTMADVDNQFREAYQALDGDGYGRNQIKKAKVAMEQKLRG